MRYNISHTEYDYNYDFNQYHKRQEEEEVTLEGLKRMIAGGQIIVLKKIDFENQIMYFKKVH